MFLGTADYKPLLARPLQPTALGVRLAAGGERSARAGRNRRQLGPPHSGLEVSDGTSAGRSVSTSLTSEGLGRLGEIATLMLLAAILADGGRADLHPSGSDESRLPVCDWPA